MKPTFLAILLISIIETQAVSQVLTTVKFTCDIYSDSSLSLKAYRIKRKDSVSVSGFNVMSDSYRVTHNAAEGHVYKKNLKNNPELTVLRSKAYSSGNKRIMKSRTKNNIAINVFGDASTLSVNYERLFFIGPSFFLAGKIGTGYLFEAAFPGGLSSWTMPFHVTVNLGARKHFVEFGMGFTTFLAGYEHNHGDGPFRYVIVGYRFQPYLSNLHTERKYTFKFNLLYGRGDAAWSMTPIGITIGKTF